MSATLDKLRENSIKGGTASCNLTYRQASIISKVKTHKRRTVVSYQNENFFICLLALSSLHNSREDGGNEGSAHLDEKFSF